MSSFIIELNVLYFTKYQLLDKAFFNRKTATYTIKNVHLIDILEECLITIQKNNFNLFIAEFSANELYEIPKLLQYLETDQINLPIIIITDTTAKKFRTLLTSSGLVYYIDSNKSPDDLITELEKKINKIIKTSVQVRSNSETSSYAQENSSNYKTYFELANDAIVVYTLNDNNEVENFIDANDKACKLLEFTREELLKMKPWDLTNPNYVNVFQNLLSTLLAEKHLFFETTVITHSEREITLEINARLFEYNNKHTVLLIARDITERKSMEQLLIQQKEALREFAHITAHDLRNPLTAIYGYTNLLKQGYETTYVDKILLLTQNMLGLIKKSLALADAGMSIGTLEPVDLNECVRYVVEHAVPKNITITIGDLPIVKGDRQKIIQMFQNLLENAVTHGEPKLIEINCLKTNNRYQLRITNDGKEIPAYIKEKMFKQKLTTKNETGGYGLLIVQKVIESHGWEIKLLDEPKTSFQITIPKSP